MKAMLLALLLLCVTGINVQAEVKNGQASPDFTLIDSLGKSHHLSDYQGKFVVLEWVNPECPFVIKHYSSGNMQKLQNEYTDKDIVWLTINSSAVGKQGQYSPKQFNEWAQDEEAGFSALLLDTDGKVGNLYGAKTTPHMFIINPKGILIYQGAIDSIASADQGDIAKSQNYVQAALNESLAGKPVTTGVTKSYGCSVKY